MRGEVLSALPSPREKLIPVSRWSSTWVLSSIQTLKGRGHFERYEKHLPGGHRDAILLAAGSQWLPVELARVHYEAIDALGMSRDEALAMGARAGRFVTRPMPETSSAIDMKSIRPAVAAVQSAQVSITSGGIVAAGGWGGYP